MAGVLKTMNYDGRGRGHYRIGGMWDPNISSEEAIIVASAGAMVAGTVLGKITASGKYKKYDPVAVDGSEVAANAVIRSEERRVGKECVSTCRARWWRYP